MVAEANQVLVVKSPRSWQQAIELLIPSNTSEGTSEINHSAGIL